MPEKTLITNQTEFLNRIKNKNFTLSRNQYFSMSKDLESNTAVLYGWDTVEQDVIKKFQIDNEEQIKPFWLYIRVLNELFTSNQDTLLNTLPKYQIITILIFYIKSMRSIRLFLSMTAWFINYMTSQKRKSPSSKTKQEKKINESQ